MMGTAWAQSGGMPGTPPAWVTLLPFVGIFGIMYFLMIRPEQKRRAEHEQMLAAIKKNDQVVVNGMFGRVITLGEKVLGVEIAQGVRVQVERSAVQRIEGTTADTRDKEREKS